MSYIDPPQRPGIIGLTAGVIFPMVVIAIELVTGLCANAFFDPMPTIGHALFVGAAPFVNLLLWRNLRNALPSPKWLPLAAGAAAAISAAYVILLLPLMPLAAVAIIFLGIGLLPFAPLATLIAGIRWTTVLAERTEKTASRVVTGAGLGVMLLLAVDLPASAAYLALGWARGGGEQERRAVTLMRTMGDREMLLRLCYGDAGRATGLLSFLLSSWAHGISGSTTTAESTTARELYFRVTGTAFNAVERPVPGRGRRWAFIWDEDQAGEAVGGRVPGLSLMSSRIDGSAAVADNLGYFEWTAEIANAGNTQREARLTLALPDGAVASRATLWVDGEPREASVARRGDARAAYSKVVTAQRDPLLVTTAGAARLLVQAFPIQPGSSIKFRVGYTAPFNIAPDGRRALALPAIVERNFALPDDLKHSVWIDGDTRIAVRGGALDGTLAQRNATRIHGDLSDGDLLRKWPVIVAPTIHASTTRTGFAPGWGKQPPLGITQTIERMASPPPGALVVLLDGSAANADAGAALRRALDAIPAGQRVGLIIAAEQPVIVPAAPWSDAQRRRLERTIAATRFVGGQDNVAALIQAIADLSSGNGNLLWIHGPQPVRFSRSSAQLEQLLERSTQLPRLVRYQPVSGPTFHLDGERWFETARQLSPTANTIGDLRDTLVELTSSGPRWRITRTNGGDATASGAMHIVRLWAADRIAVAAAARGKARDEAIRLAHRLNLVAPVSGAVVLETDRDYGENGLPVPSAEDVPTVPEPGASALLAIVLALAVWQARRRLLPGAFA